jgi:hypothetical protein
MSNEPRLWRSPKQSARDTNAMMPGPEDLVRLPRHGTLEAVGGSH